MRLYIVRNLMIVAVALLFIGSSPVCAQEDERDWQDILKDVVQDAVEDGSSSKRLGRIRDIDVVNRSASVIELEVVLQKIADPDRVVLTVDVFDETYDVLEGFETKHDPIPEGDGTVLVQVAYRGSEDVRSVGAKVNLIDVETRGVSTRRKVALPWEWSGDGSGGYQSSGGSMADPDGLSTRAGSAGTVEEREPQIVTIEPRRMPGTPKMEQIDTNLVAAATQNRPQAATQTREDNVHPARRPPPPTSSSSGSTGGKETSGISGIGTSSSGKKTSTTTATVNSTAATMASANLVMVTSLDLYEIARAATWKSKAGTLPFNGKTSDNRGFVRALGKTALSNGRAYEKVLQTHPEWKDGGYILGSYKVVIPPAATRFEAKVGFLPKVTRSDGVRVSVSLRQGSKPYRLIQKNITPADGVVALRATLPESARGKEVTVVLRVSTGTTSTQDWFAWSEPVIK